MDDMQNLEDTGEERDEGGGNVDAGDEEEGWEASGEVDGDGEEGEGGAANDGDADSVDLLDLSTTEPEGRLVGIQCTSVSRLVA